MGKKKAKIRSKEGKRGNSKNVATSPAPQGKNSSSHPPKIKLKRNNNYPQPFPSSLPKPPNNNFLQNTNTYKESYTKALQTSYEGFTNDTPNKFQNEEIRNALQVLETNGYFRTDITQPFGLGSKCAKTYVQRCLLGEEGTTYKYLGLRMFASPWNGNHAKNEELKHALQTIHGLNNTLSQRTKLHLDTLSKKRKSRGEENTCGRNIFDIALINRMEYSNDLKVEPMTGEGRCTVSWHADSCLEHYSTIAVYHTIFHTTDTKDDNDWKVVLRVAHDSEGPNASKPNIITTTPPISTSLPSGSAYYLLDDFNHHHQHAVLAPNAQNDTIRYSSTHRLLRQGHNVQFVLERCKSITSNFHKKGVKVWKSEQLLLSDLESEWIRQFYIQGLDHKNVLWGYWKEPICRLLQYWSKLECRTKQVITLLQLAAEDRCDIGNDGNREERKIRDKRKKASLTISDLLDRNSDTNACDTLYEPMATLLEERAKQRELWYKRQKDAVFTTLERQYQPLDPPFLFQQDDATNNFEEMGKSPLVGKSHQLQHLVSCIRSWGKAYKSCNASDLPKQSNILHSSSNNTDEHAKTLSWNGWSNPHLKFGLEMQYPWSNLLLSGKKQIETRAYNLPSSLLNTKIYIIESKPGKPGISSLPNTITPETNTDVKIIGWVIFNKIKIYKDFTAFHKDEALHLVTNDSGYGWSNTIIYGWVVSSKGFYKDERDIGVLIRRMRSLFEIKDENSSTERNDHGKKVKEESKKKKKRSGVHSNGLDNKKKRRY